MNVTDTISSRITHGLVNTKDIVVDEHGQRDVERRRSQFNKIMKNFDPLKVNDLKLALIDGKFFCFDGQMTMKVLKAKNGGKDLEVPCRIYHGLTLLETADLFCEQNQNNSPVKLSDVLRVKAAYGDKNAISFMKCTENGEVDLSWTGTKAKNTITCISTAYQSFLRFKDQKLYTKMLKTIKDAWGGLPDAFDARIIKGMTELFLAYPDLDAERLTKKLAFTRPSDVIRDAQIDRASGPRKYAVILLQHYNHGLREEKKLVNKL